MCAPWWGNQDLMTVCKSNKSGKVEVASSVYSVNKVRS